MSMCATTETEFSTVSLDVPQHCSSVSVRCYMLRRHTELEVCLKTLSNQSLTRLGTSSTTGIHNKQHILLQHPSGIYLRRRSAMHVCSESYVFLMPSRSRAPTQPSKPRRLRSWMSVPRCHEVQCTTNAFFFLCSLQGLRLPRHIRSNTSAGLSMRSSDRLASSTQQ